MFFRALLFSCLFGDEFTAKSSLSMIPSLNTCKKRWEKEKIRVERENKNTTK